MNINCHAIKLDHDDLFKNRPKRRTFLLRPFLTILNLEAERISLQKLDYEMDRTDYPVDYSFLK